MMLWVSAVLKRNVDCSDSTNLSNQDHVRLQTETEGNKKGILTFFIMAGIIALHRAKTHISNDDVIILLFDQ